MIYFLFLHYFHYNIIAIHLISLDYNAGPSCCIVFDINNTFVVLTTYKPLIFTVVIWLHCILRQKYEERCVFVIYRHKGKCNSLRFILLLSFLSYRKHIQEKARWLFIIVLHFVKKIVWYWSVFTQYSYYHDLFCLGPELHLCHHHCHAQVRYFDTTKIMVWCMSSILIHMTHFSFYVLSSYWARSSEPQVVSMYYLIVS